MAKKSEIEVKWVGSQHPVFWQSPHPSLQGVAGPVLHCAVAQLLPDQLSRARIQLVLLLVCLVRNRSLQSLGAWTDQMHAGYLWQVSAVGEVMGV